MHPTQCSNVVEYVRHNKYPADLKKQDKFVLQRFAKNFTFDEQANALFCVDKAQDGSTFKRLVITEEEKSRVFHECHSAGFAGHAGRDNTIQKLEIATTGPSTIRKLSKC